jgi:hypothetical protein
MGTDYVNESNFIIRKSGRENNSYYIDYMGVYKIVDIAKLVHLDSSLIKEKYLQYDAVYFSEFDIYYFNDIAKAKSAVAEVLKHLSSSQKGRIIQLTEAEIEYIRQALINEGVNNIRVSSKVKDNIFKKLNS